MAHRKQILVLESENLLTNSIVSLLSSRKEYAVSSAKFSTLTSLDQPNGQEPDVIILDQRELTANITTLMELVDRYPKLRLIVLGLDDNQLRVFDKHVVQASHVSDFLELLNSSSG